MKILVTGASGMLGTDVCQTLERVGHHVVGVGHKSLDISRAQVVADAVDQLRPDVVINCAAYTRVDDCESQRDTAFLVNALGPRNLATACDGIGAALVQVSTDYVFDGQSGSPYRETDAVRPLSEYGRTKLAGEDYVRALCRRHWVVRTQWLFGVHGHNFVRTMRQLAAERDHLTVVDDQFGVPTYTRDLAEAIAQLIGDSTYGVYHLTNAGQCSWFEFAEAIVRDSGFTTPVNPMKTVDLKRPAPRPLFSVLENYVWRLEGRPALRDWREALSDYLSAL